MVQGAVGRDNLGNGKDYRASRRCYDSIMVLPVVLVHTVRGLLCLVKTALDLKGENLVPASDQWEVVPQPARAQQGRGQDWSWMSVWRSRLRQEFSLLSPGSCREGLRVALVVGWAGMAEVRINVLP